MASDPTDLPTAETDTFGVPHGHAVSGSLHLWIILPGLAILILIGTCASG